MIGQPASKVDSIQPSAPLGRISGRLRRAPKFKPDLSAEYSWEQLAPHQRQAVKAMVRHAEGQRRAQLMTLLVVLLVALAALGAILFLTPGTL